MEITKCLVTLQSPEAGGWEKPCCQKPRAAGRQTSHLPHLHRTRSLSSRGPSLATPNLCHRKENKRGNCLRKETPHGGPKESTSSLRPHQMLPAAEPLSSCQPSDAQLPVRATEESGEMCLPSQPRLVPGNSEERLKDPANIFSV